MIDILVCLGICLVLYVIFNKSGFKGGFLFIIILTFGYLYYIKVLTIMYNRGLLYLILTIVAVFLLQLISTLIVYYIYDRVPLVIYLILSTIIEYCMKIVISFVLIYILSLNLKTNNTVPFKEQVNYITSTINLNIDLINVGTGSQMVSLEYACNNPSILKSVVTTSDIDFYCAKNFNMLGEVQYNFRLKGINRFEGNEANISCSLAKCQ